MKRFVRADFHQSKILGFDPQKFGHPSKKALKLPKIAESTPFDVLRLILKKRNLFTQPISLN
jgi:hypothetical protein